MKITPTKKILRLQYVLENPPYYYMLPKSCYSNISVSTS